MRPAASEDDFDSLPPSAPLKPSPYALYASNAPYGGNIVGLSAAAWRYFGRPPEDLSWAEAALLAVLPKSPALIHPGRNRGELVRRRDALLRDLESVGAIGPVELALALREGLPEAPRPLPRLAPHLLASLSASHPEQDRFATTLDRPLQTEVIERVERHAVRLESMGIDNLAVVVLDRQPDVWIYDLERRTRHKLAPESTSGRYRSAST